MLAKQLIVLKGQQRPSLNLDFAKTPLIPSALTFTRSTVATVVDFEGLVKTAKVNEARFANARRVENLIGYSEAFDNAYWVKDAGVSVTPNTVIAPNGQLTADTVSGATSNKTVYKNISITGSSVFSVYLKALPGHEGETVTVGVNGTYYTKALTSSWTRICSGILTITSVEVGAKNSATASSFYVWGAQIESVTGQANQNPSEYISTNVLSYPYHGAGVDGVKCFTTTNGNTVSSNFVTESAGSLLAGPIALQAEEARTNLLLNSASPVTQNITTTAQTYTISMWGTGTCTLTGTATGTLTGTGATVRVSLTVTATAGTLTLTFAGTNTNGQLEAAVNMSSYINTAGTALTRTLDTPSFTGAGLSWYNAQQGAFVVEASGKTFNAPYNLGALGLTYATKTKYCLSYNNTKKSGNTYLYTASTLGNPVEFTGVSVPSTLYVNSGGVANISRFVFYKKALKTTKMAALL
jgi:hypothetical protein